MQVLPTLLVWAALSRLRVLDLLKDPDEVLELPGMIG